MICPFVADQPFWAARVNAAGAAPAAAATAAHRRGPGAGAVRHAVDDPDMSAHAEALGEKIRAENGVAAAIKILEAVSR